MKKRTTTLAALLFVFGLSASAQTLIISDPLTDGTTKGVLDVSCPDATAAFTADGWQPGASGDNQNHILYDVPFMFKEGYMEFEVKGISKPSNVDFDPAFCGIYDGRGINEPILYFNDFKQNYYRWNVHFRGDNGLFKCKIQMAANTEEKDTRDKAVLQGAEYSKDAQCVDEPNGQAVSWDATKWYKFKVEWKARKYTVYVDGTSKWSSTRTCDYTPRDMKIWLGCAPGTSGKYTASMVGATYKNFKLYTYDTPKFNCGYGTVNLPATSFVSFGKNIKNETRVKEFFFENLSSTVSMPITIASSSADFTVASSSFTLAPNEKKFVDITMNTTAALAKRTTFTVSSAGILTTPYSITCTAAIVDGSVNIVSAYEDLFTDASKTGYFNIENPASYTTAHNLAAGTFDINVKKATNFSAIYFTPKLGLDSFFIDMTTAPYIAVRVKSDKPFLLQLGCNNFGATGNNNRDPFDNINVDLPETNIDNVLGGNVWQWVVFDFTQIFITKSVTPNMIYRIYFNFDPGILLTANVSFDQWVIGAKALDYLPINGIKDSKSNDTNLFYPNPANNSITINDITNVSKIIITDISGRKMLESFPTNASVSISDFKSGIYFVSLINKDKSTHIQKLIKN